MRRRREAALVVQEQNRPWRYRERRAAPPEQPVGGGGGGSTFPPFLFSAHTGAVFSVPRRFWLRRGPFSVSIPFWRCMQPETPPFLDSFYHSCVPCPVLHLIYFSSRRWLWRSKSNVRSPRVSLSRPPVFRLPPNEEEFPFQNLYTLSHEERSLLLPACLPAIMADIETCSRAMQGVSLDQSGESRPSPTPQGNKTPTLPSNLPTGALLRFFWVKNLCVYRQRKDVGRWEITCGENGLTSRLYCLGPFPSKISKRSMYSHTCRRNAIYVRLCNVC